MRFRTVLGAVSWLALSAATAHAQSSLLQGGPSTAGHAPMYVNQGQTQPIVQDSGPAAGGGPGVGLSELLIVQRAAGTGPDGEHFCMYDAPTTSANGYHYLCLDPNANGGGLLSYGAGGTATPDPLSFMVNGAAYQFPFVTSGVVGPSSSTIGDFAIWNNTAGTLLKDVTAGAGVLTALSLPANGSGSVLLETAPAINRGLSVTGAGPLINLFSSPPVNGDYIQGGGYNLQMAFTGVVVPPNPILGHEAIYGVTTVDASAGEYTQSIYTYVNSGLAARWTTSTTYAANAEVVANGNIYKTTAGGTSASSGGGPNCGSGTCTDGTITWAYIASNTSNQGKVGLFIATLTGPGAGGSWAQANDFIMGSGTFLGAGAFYVNTELDVGNQAGNCVIGLCNAYDLYLAGDTSFPITAIEAITTTASGNFAAHYGLLFGVTPWLVDNVVLEIDSSAPAAIGFGDIAATTFSTATMLDKSTSPVSLFVQGSHATSAIVVQNSNPAANGLWLQNTYSIGVWLTGTATSAQIEGTNFEVDPVGATIVSTLDISNIPTSAGTGGLYVCADSAGNTYKKSSCP